jgi:hypothetical protein
LPENRWRFARFFTAGRLVSPGAWFGLDAQQAVKLAIDIQDGVLAVMRAD